LEKRPSSAILQPIKPRGVFAISPRAPAKTPSKAKTTVKATPAKKPASKSAAKTVAKPAAKAAVKSVKKPSAKTTPAKAAKKLIAAKKSTPVKAASAPAKKLSPAQIATEALCKQISKILDTNKAEQITTLNLRDKCSFADFMIVASGRAPRHVTALADYVADMLKKMGIPPLSVEGKESGDWVLIDAGDIVVHIFRPEVRQFYNIEKMWAMPAATY
jgi:ribosome-associated protein